MNKLFLLCGIVLLGSTSTPQEEKPPIACSNSEIEYSITEAPKMVPLIFHAEVKTPAAVVSGVTMAEPTEIDLDDIIYLEEEPEVNLGFDPTDYLPKDFDPHSFYFDMNTIEFVEEEIEIDLGFDSGAYLPDGFDPYAIPEDINSISYIEEEPELDLGFDTAEYLPAGFDPYEVYFDLNAVEYIEEDEVELDFDVNDYLPEGFDPYLR